MKKTAAQLVQEANAEITTVSLDEARALHGQAGVSFIDIRDIRELQKLGKIAGAAHAPRGMLEFWADPESPYHRDLFASGNTLVLYCASAWRSALATKTLQDMGVEKVCHLEGGFSAWADAGGPIDALESRS